MKTPAPGFTLLELLAVIVIVAMAAAVMSVSLAATDDQAAIMNVIAQCRDLDAMARQVAQTHGAAATLRLNENGDTIALEAARERLSVVKFPVGVKVEFLTNDELTRAIKFDRAGRSPDYSFTLHQYDRRHSRGRGRVCGLTGFIIEEHSQ